MRSKLGYTATALPLLSYIGFAANPHVYDRSTFRKIRNIFEDVRLIVNEPLHTSMSHFLHVGHTQSFTPIWDTVVCHEVIKFRRVLDLIANVRVLHVNLLTASIVHPLNELRAFDSLWMKIVNAVRRLHGSLQYP